MLSSLGVRGKPWHLQWQGTVLLLCLDPWLVVNMGNMTGNESEQGQLLTVGRGERQGGGSGLNPNIRGGCGPSQRASWPSSIITGPGLSGRAHRGGGVCTGHDKRGRKSPFRVRVRLRKRRWQGHQPPACLPRALAPAQLWDRPEPEAQCAWRPGEAAHPSRVPGSRGGCEAWPPGVRGSLILLGPPSWARLSSQQTTCWAPAAYILRDCPPPAPASAPSRPQEFSTGH